MLWDPPLKGMKKKLFLSTESSTLLFSSATSIHKNRSVFKLHLRRIALQGRIKIASAIKPCKKVNKTSPPRPVQREGRRMLVEHEAFPSYCGQAIEARMFLRSPLSVHLVNVMSRPCKLFRKFSYPLESFTGQSRSRPGEETKEREKKRKSSQKGQREVPRGQDKKLNYRKSFRLRETCLICRKLA